MNTQAGPHVWGEQQHPAAATPAPWRPQRATRAWTRARSCVPTTSPTWSTGPKHINIQAQGGFSTPGRRTTVSRPGRDYISAANTQNGTIWTPLVVPASVAAPLSPQRSVPPAVWRVYACIVGVALMAEGWCSHGIVTPQLVSHLAAEARRWPHRAVVGQHTRQWLG